MTDPANTRLRSAVYEIVNAAPLAPTIEDLAERPVSRPRRSPLLIPTIAVLIAVAVLALSSRLDDSTGTNATTTIESTTSSPHNPEMRATEGLRVLRDSEAAVGNVQTLADPLITDCMASRGFAFAPTSNPLITGQDQSAFLKQRYPEPRTQDGTWGYLFDGDDTAATEQHPVDPASIDSRAPGYADAIQGQTVATDVVRDLDGQIVTWNQIGDGCYGQAVAEIFGSSQAYLNFLTALNQLEVIAGASWNALRDHPEYVARNASWSECMKNAGFDYATIFDPMNRDWSSPRPTPTEQRVAQADSTCRLGLRLTGPDLFSLEEPILAGLLTEHPIAGYTEFDRQAQALLAGRSPAGG